MDGSPETSGVYGDASYSYDYAAWNDAQIDGAYDHPPEAEPSTSTVSNLPGHPGPHTYHDAPSQHLAYDENEGLDFLREEYTEEELRELCEKPLQLDEPTQMELNANIDPLFGRVYKQDRPVEERPGDFVAAMASIRHQVARLSQTELFDSIPQFPNDGGNPVPAKGGGGIQGPSVTDAVDIDGLLTEMGGSPPHNAQ